MINAKYFLIKTELQISELNLYQEGCSHLVMITLMHMRAVYIAKIDHLDAQNFIWIEINTEIHQSYD